MKVYSYIPKGALNEATIFYLKMIEEAFSLLNYKCERIEKVKKSKKNIIITIRPRDLLLYKIQYPNNYFINWFQGIGPEEFLMIKREKWYKNLGSSILKYSEMKALKSCSLNIFVSNAMEVHYEQKYKIVSKESIIIPCFNKNLQEQSIQKREKEYKEFSFVYAGTLYPWQCLERTLKIYKEIENQYIDSSLTILTKDKESALKLLKEYRIKNYFIDFVPLELLEKKLENFKYGFLIRDESIVNYVATPTKMNSYLSLGLIPIYTNVIESFNKNLNLENYGVCLNNKDSAKQMADKIIGHHYNINLNSKKHLLTLKKVFNGYYSEYNYKQLLAKKCKTFFKI